MYRILFSIDETHEYVFEQKTRTHTCILWRDACFDILSKYMFIWSKQCLECGYVQYLVHVLVHVSR